VLEEARLADAIPADPARRHVRNAPRCEPQPRIRDVHARREHVDADRFDRGDLRPDHRQQDIEVVNHQIEDHVDVEAALGECAETMNFDESGAGDEWKRRGDSRIEALGMTCRQHDATPLGRIDQAIRIGHR
jgi:hypothetical protein